MNREVFDFLQCLAQLDLGSAPTARLKTTVGNLSAAGLEDPFRGKAQTAASNSRYSFQSPVKHSLPLGRGSVSGPPCLEQPLDSHAEFHHFVWGLAGLEMRAIHCPLIRRKAQRQGSHHLPWAHVQFELMSPAVSKASFYFVLGPPRGSRREWGPD
jgi:hypothetical protein